MSNTTRRRPRPARLIAAGFALGAVACIAGCNIAAPVAYAITGPGSIDAQFTLSSDRPTIVLVDDPASKVSQRRQRAVIADVATRTLMERRVLNDAIDSRAGFTVTSRDRHGELVSRQEVGEAVGAEVIVYALVSEFTLSREDGTYLPEATLWVHVFDVAEGRPIWPGDPNGIPVRVQIPYRTGSVPRSGSELVAAEEELARQAGIAVAQLFYRHERTQSATR